MIALQKLRRSGHGPDGSGHTPMGKRTQIRNARSPEVQKQMDGELATFITNGKPLMPAYGKTLTSGDIRQLVACIRSIAAKSLSVNSQEQHECCQLERL